ncbi:YncE family protein, partial [Rhodococcus sp. IEGM 1379]|uniref:YncE family protein n=1 Tax=Rhodococcus sp. IEGM 1379 TaxID=3047086 RepID=UPI0024B65B59
MWPLRTRGCSCAPLAVDDTSEGPTTIADIERSHPCPRWPQTAAVTVTIAVGASPTGIAITPDGARAYVTNYYGNSVSVIETATNTVDTNTITVGANPVGVAITPDGTRA